MVFDEAEVFKAKIKKMDSPTASTRASSSPSSSPGLSSSNEDFDDQSEQLCRNEGAWLDSAIEAAVQIFKEAWLDFAFERAVGDAAKAEHNEDRAAEVSEQRLAKRYDEIKAGLLDLLPFVGSLESCDDRENYHVVEFHGRSPPRRILKGKELDEAVKAKYTWLRGDAQGRAREAFCAVLAAMSTRKEKCWMEANDIAEDLKAQLALRQSTKAMHLKPVIRNFLDRECSMGYGFFAKYMVRSCCTFRVAFSVKDTIPAPASLVITSRMSLWEALESLDGDFPLRGEAKSLDWCKRPGTEFALQEANFGVEENDRRYRAAAASLKADTKLRDLLLSKRPCVQLEILAALAPRDVAREKGLSTIVKAECARVMKEAKVRGEAVVFCLGSDAPHKLCEKVYMKPPINDFGLRCGYLRWRSSCDEPWARETSWDDRTCLCLQMP